MGGNKRRGEAQHVGWFRSLSGEVRVGLFAAMLTALSMLYTCHVQVEQDRRWDINNVARMDLKKVGLVTFRRMTGAEVRATKPYLPYYALRTIENGVSSQDYAVHYELVLLPTKDPDWTPVGEPFYSTDEAEQVRAALGPGAAQIILEQRVHLRFFVDLTNGGETQATNVKLSVIAPNELGQPAGDFLKIAETWECPPEQGVSGWKEFYIPLDVPIEGTLPLTVKVEYKDVNSKVHRDAWPVKWDLNTNKWTVGQKTTSVSKQ